MRRLSRLERSLDLMRPRSTLSPSPFHCSACARPSPFSTSTTRDAKEKLPYTEKLRRKLWGTDQPPGQADPYGQDSFVQQQVQIRNARRGQKPREAVTESSKELRDDLPVEIQLKHDNDYEDTYEPATSWDGLEYVGEVAEQDFEFEGFMPERRDLSDSETTAALHRAIVETFTLRDSGLPLSQIGAGVVQEDITTAVQITLTDNAVALQFSDDAVTPQDIIQSLTTSYPETVVDETKEKLDPTESEEDVAADRSTVDPLHPQEDIEIIIDETAEKSNPTESEEDVAADRSTVDPLLDAQTKAQIASWDPVWKSISLEDPEIKFAVIKRTMQLTGIRVLDPNINSINTVQQLLGNLVKKEKPRKLAQSLEHKAELVALPNVKIIGKRVTEVDKETSVGRWKIIEAELTRRGLPVYS